MATALAGNALQARSPNSSPLALPASRDARRGGAVHIRRQGAQVIDRHAREEGERIRLRHTVEHLKAVVDSIEVALRLEGPIGTELAQTLTQVAIAGAMQIAKHDAFAMAANDTKGSAR